MVGDILCFLLQYIEVAYAVVPFTIKKKKDSKLCDAKALTNVSLFESLA